MKKDSPVEDDQFRKIIPILIVYIIGAMSIFLFMVWATITILRLMGVSI